METQGGSRWLKVEFILIGVLTAVMAIVAFKYVGVNATTTITFDTPVGSLEARLTFNKEKLSQPELITAENGKQGENLQIAMESKH